MNSLEKDQLLDTLQKSINTFQDQLSTERELLLAGNANDLNQITLQKQETISQLAELETHFASLVADIDKDSQFKEKWFSTINMLKTCQKMNTENSALVNHRLKQTNSTLHQLHSLFNSGQSVTYSEDGSQSVSSVPNRSIHA